MTLKQVKEKSNQVYLQWLVAGMPEAYEEFNDSNREIIKAYISEFPDAIGYKFNEGFVEVKSDKTLYNFCCDYIFDGNFMNMSRVQKMHEQYAKSGKVEDLQKLQTVLEKANGICLIWS